MCSLLTLKQWCLESNSFKCVGSENLLTLHVGKWLFYKARPALASSLSGLMPWLVYTYFWKVQKTLDKSKRNVMGQGRETVWKTSWKSGSITNWKLDPLAGHQGFLWSAVWRLNTVLSYFPLIYYTWYSVKCIFFSLQLAMDIYRWK